jgi:hypothetical protein
MNTDGQNRFDSERAREWESENYQRDISSLSQLPTFPPVI